MSKKHLAAALLAAGAVAWAVPAQAGYIVTLTQQGSNVVANGSGSIDLTGLTFLANSDHGAAIEPIAGIILAGPVVPIPSFDEYLGFTGPANFGGGSETDASGGSGDLVGIAGAVNELVVPMGYVSGTALLDTATWDNQTFSSLGATPGTYVWSWGSGATADTFTLHIGVAAVPEPSTLALLGFGIAAFSLIGFASRRRICGRDYERGMPRAASPSATRSSSTFV